MKLERTVTEEHHYRFKDSTLNDEFSRGLRLQHPPSYRSSGNKRFPRASPLHAAWIVKGKLATITG